MATRHGQFLKSTCDKEPIHMGKNIIVMTWAISIGQVTFDHFKIDMEFRKIVAVDIAIT